MPKGNVPYKFTSEAQDERAWKSRRQRDGQNFLFNKYDKEKYRKNYDEIDWSK